MAFVCRHYHSRHCCDELQPRSFSALALHTVVTCGGVCDCVRILAALQLVESGSGVTAVLRRIPMAVLETAPEEVLEDFLSRGQVGRVSC